MLSNSNQSGHYPNNKITILGSGIIGALEAYFAFLAAAEPIRITIYDKNPSVANSTSAIIIPSLTPDEILSVVPRGPVLMEKLGILFSQPGGIRVDDVKGVNDSEVGKRFIEEVQEYSKDEVGHAARTKTLLALGKQSMDLWQKIYDEADRELQQILEESNFNPCREEKKAQQNMLHDGYRIDLIYNVPDAKSRAEGMKNDYENLGYARCKILSPSEVKSADPFLADFCDAHSELNAAGERVWKNDAVALYRPGGCLDSGVFLPKFYAYLKKRMGQYRSDDGQMKDCFQIQFDKNVAGVIYDEQQASVIKGLRFFDNSIKQNKHAYQQSDYVICPGEAVGTMDRFGWDEPAYSGFAGATLMLTIPLTDELREKYKSFNHCMEVHQEGVCLAWQARYRNGEIFIAVGGTKAFYADKKPNVDEAFAKNRNLLQFNMINNVLPEFISLALGRDTKDKQLTEHDLNTLVQMQIAKRGVATRAVTYDGVPTLGKVRKKDGEILQNARVTTHLGSGGVSFAPAAVRMSRFALNDKQPEDRLANDVLTYSSSFRTAK